MPTITAIHPTQAFPLQRIGIIGCGLMGGSIAQAAREIGCDVVVYDVDATSLEQAASAGLTVTDSPGGACVERDLVLLCTPVDQLLGLIPKIRPYLSADTIVSDIGSVKGPARVLVSSLSTDRVRVLPSHPMAGSERSGFTAAHPHLLEGCTWLVCDQPTNRDAKRFAAFTQRIGTARTLSCSIDAHDVVCAVVSHLPQVTATLLAATAGEAEDSLVPGAFVAAGSGFADSTRVADSAISMWGPILEENSVLVSSLLRTLADKALQLADALDAGDQAGVADVFAEGHVARDRWRRSQPATPTAPPVPEPDNTPRWTDPASGQEVWVDDSLGWETVRTGEPRPLEHGVLVARYLATQLAVDPDRVSAALGDELPNHARVAAALQSNGIDVDCRETYTADGIQVSGLVFPEGRFLIVA